METNSIDRILLIIDSAGYHLTSKVKKICDELNIKLLFIPPRLTRLLQPADVCWFASLKKQYHKLWNHWFIHGEKTITRFDNVRSPGYQQCIRWLSEMWDEFPEHNIINSFEYCGIVSQYNLHDCLKTMMRTNTIIGDFVDDSHDCDNIDGFESEDEIFDEQNIEETHKNQHEISDDEPTPHQPPPPILQSPTPHQHPPPIFQSPTPSQTEAILHSILNQEEEMTTQFADQNINHVLQPNNSLLNLQHSPAQDALRKENVKRKPGRPKGTKNQKKNS